MARHRDIERAHAKLEGTSWHIETLLRQSTGSKKDKRNCIYYQKASKKCEYLGSYCMGSGDCSHYQKRQEEISQ